jgi:RNA polymerase primary sigma factor
MAEKREEAVVFHFRGESAPSLLLPEEEVALAKRIERGDEEAEAEFLEANVRLTLSIARGYRNRGLSFPDLVQEGNIGLLKAVRRFDWRRGVRFSTYATWWIRHFLNRAMDDQSRDVRIPVHMLQDIGWLERAWAILIKQHDRRPTDQELAEKLGWPLKKIRKVAAIRKKGPRFRTAVVNQFQEDDVSCIREEDLPGEAGSPPDDEAFLRELRLCVDELLPQLDLVERDIVKYRLEKEYVMAEIGEWHNLSRERIRQKEVVVIAKLRRHLAKRLGIRQALEDND